MLISFAITKEGKKAEEYEMSIDKEDIDKKYCGDVKDAIKDMVSKILDTNLYFDDIEILEEEFEYQDALYDEVLQDEYEAEKELQNSQYYRDLI